MEELIVLPTEDSNTLDHLVTHQSSTEASTVISESEPEEVIELHTVLYEKLLRFSQSIPSDTYPYLSNIQVLQWLYTDTSFLDEKTKSKEDEWGKRVISHTHPNPTKMWSSVLGQKVAEDLYRFLGKNPKLPEKKQHQLPDLETEEAIIEIKTQSYYTSGTAGEKILGVPFKYSDVPLYYNKPLIILCIGGAEQKSRELYGNLDGNCQTERKIKLLQIYKEQFQIEYIAFTNLLNNLLE